MALAVTPDDNGYYPYYRSKSIQNGSTTEYGNGDSMSKFKIQNNMLYHFFGFGEPTTYKYHHSENGNDIYYHWVYNHGGLTFGNGYVMNEKIRAIVGPGANVINIVDDHWNKREVYKLYDNSRINDLIE